jgi:hypothetical protein
VRRHVRTVRRKRFLEVLGERDAASAALPGLACGLCGLGVVLFAADLGRARAGSSRPDVRASVSSSVSSVGSATLKEGGR